MDNLLASLGIDVTTLLQGGALAFIGGIVGTAAIREVRRQIRRGLWRNIRRSQTYKQLFGLLGDTWPYIVLGILAALADPALVLYIPITLLLASLARRLPWSNTVAYWILVAGYALLAQALTPPYGAAVVLLAGALRFALPIIWKRSK